MISWVGRLTIPEKCKEQDSYRECPKIIRLESLDRVVEDNDGNSTPLHDLIADDNADFISRLDAKPILNGYPKRFVQLAYKKYAGHSLISTKRNYYLRELTKAQETLV